MIYVMTNTTNPTDYFRTGCPRQAVTVARRWKTLGKLEGIDVLVGGGDHIVRFIRIPLGKKWETIAAIRAAMD